MKRQTCYIYARTTIKGMHNPTVCIEGQIKVCLEYAKKHDFRVVGIYEDMNVSGATERRKGLQDMLKHIQHPSIKSANIILVTRTDNLSRRTKTILKIKQLLDENNITLISIFE